MRHFPETITSFHSSGALTNSNFCFTARFSSFSDFYLFRNSWLSHKVFLEGSYGRLFDKTFNNYWWHKWEKHYASFVLLLCQKQNVILLFLRFWEAPNPNSRSNELQVLVAVMANTSKEIQAPGWGRAQTKSEMPHQGQNKLQNGSQSHDPIHLCSHVLQLRTSCFSLAMRYKCSRIESACCWRTNALRSEFRRVWTLKIDDFAVLW